MKKLIAAVALIAATSCSASAADLASRPYAKAPIAATIYDWTGFYIGGQVGGASVSPSFKDYDDWFDNQGLNGDRKFGFTGGVYGGYNWQFRSFLVGVEGFWSGYGSTSVTNYPFPGSTDLLSTKLRDAAGVKGRFGLVFDDTMVYVAAGPTWGNFSLRSASPGDFDITSHKNVVGLSVAGGVEHMIVPNWIVRGQVQYTAFDTQKVGTIVDFGEGGTEPARFGQQTDLLEATVGISYKFGGGRY